VSRDQPDPRWKSGLHFEQRYDEEHDYELRRVRPLSLQLPHSCDAWVIGGLEEARQFLADLTEAVAEMEKDMFGDTAKAAMTPAIIERIAMDKVQRGLRILAETPQHVLVERALEAGCVYRNGQADLGALVDQMVERNEDLILLAERAIIALHSEQDLDGQARLEGITREELLRKRAIERLRQARIKAG
jgi:hypothetical protein